MAEIRCPHCGEAFTVDETEYAQIVKQVRDAEFEKDIAERVELVRQGQASAVEAAVAQANVRAQQQLSSARASLQGQLAEKDALIAKLRSEVEQGKSAVDVARLSAQREAATWPRAGSASPSSRRRPRRPARPLPARRPWQYARPPASRERRSWP